MRPVRWSYLRAMSKSPAHCLQAMRDDEDGIDLDGTPAKARGTALHAVLFDTARVVVPPEDLQKPADSWRKSKKPKPETIEKIRRWDEFIAQSQGAHILTPAKHNEVQRCAEALRRNPFAMDVLRGNHEQTILCDYMGRACRMTPDVVAPDGEYFADLKSSRTAAVDGPEAFLWQFRRYGYTGAFAFYRHAVQMKHGRKPHAYTVTVEAVRPYPVTVFRVSDRTLDIGDRIVRLQMERLLGCERSGQWPEYAQCIVELDLPDSEDLDLVFGDEDEGDDEEQDAAA